MPTPEIREIIIETVRAHQREITFSELLEELKGKGFSDDAVIKMAIWPLIAQSVLELTAARNLRLRST